MNWLHSRDYGTGLRFKDNSQGISTMTKGNNGINLIIVSFISNYDINSSHIIGIGFMTIVDLYTMYVMMIIQISLISLFLVQSFSQKNIEYSTLNNYDLKHQNQYQNAILYLIELSHLYYLYNTNMCDLTYLTITLISDSADLPLLPVLSDLTPPYLFFVDLIYFKLLLGNLLFIHYIMFCASLFRYAILDFMEQTIFNTTTLIKIYTLISHKFRYRRRG